MRFATTRRFPALSLITLAAAACLLAGLVLRTTTVHVNPPGTWITAANMNAGGYRFGGVLLPNGQVLVAGGGGAQLYTPP
jgi:hypothetical protein